MRVIRLKIENFRGISKAELHFSGHTLFVGGNNVGKSTICEALDLVLGPDRISKFPPVEEFDFYNGCYLAPDGETIIPARIEVVLTDLASEVALTCPTHLEFWHVKESRLLAEGEADKANPPVSGSWAAITSNHECSFGGDSGCSVPQEIFDFPIQIPGDL